MHSDVADRSGMFHSDGMHMMIIHCRGGIRHSVAMLAHVFPELGAEARFAAEHCIMADPLVDDALFTEMFGKLATTASAGSLLVAPPPPKSVCEPPDASMADESAAEQAESDEEGSEEEEEASSACSASLIGSVSQAGGHVQRAGLAGVRPAAPPTTSARSASARSLGHGIASEVSVAPSSAARRVAAGSAHAKWQSGGLRRVSESAPARVARTAEAPESCASLAAWGDMKLHNMSLDADWPTGQLLKVLQRARNTINENAQAMGTIGWYASAKVMALMASEGRWLKHDKVIMGQPNLNVQIAYKQIAMRIHSINKVHKCMRVWCGALKPECIMDAVPHMKVLENYLEHTTVQFAPDMAIIKAFAEFFGMCRGTQRPSQAMQALSKKDLQAQVSALAVHRAQRARPTSGDVKVTREEEQEYMDEDSDSGLEESDELAPPPPPPRRRLGRRRHRLMRRRRRRLTPQRSLRSRRWSTAST